MKKRILFSDNGTISDLSPSLAEYNAGSEVVDYTTGEDAMFIGSDFPFNSFDIEMETSNTAASAMTLQIWDGSSWDDVAEIIDGTKSGDASLCQSGTVMFVPDKDNDGWSRDDTDEMDDTDLDSVTIYDKYWIKLTFSGTMLASTAIKWVGDRFCDDADIEGYYPALVRSSVLGGFKSGKTDWKEQEINASEEIIDRFIRRGAMVTGGQVLSPRQLRIPAVHKSAVIIYRSLGRNYSEEREQAVKDYNTAINNVNLNIDSDRDARQDHAESFPRTKRMYR